MSVKEKKVRLKVGKRVKVWYTPTMFFFTVGDISLEGKIIAVYSKNKVVHYDVRISGKKQLKQMMLTMMQKRHVKNNSIVVRYRRLKDIFPI